MVDVNQDSINETAKIIATKSPNVKCLQLVVDVTDETAVDSMVDQAVQHFGSLDYGEFSMTPFLHSLLM